jgi:signal peptidase I
MKRFVVSEDSMLPTLHPGDGLLAVRSSRPRRGQIRCFEHPERPGFWLVKRVGGVRPDAFEARSDNDAPGATDSRQFGFVPAEGTYRLVVRVPRRLIGSTTHSAN